MANPLIQINHVKKCYEDNTILHDINLVINDGEFLTLLGPSGCGKTTLLRMLSGFETPDEGTIILDNQDITHVAPEHRHINMVFQSYALFPHMTVFENVAFGLECKKVPKPEIRHRVTEVLTMVELNHLAARKPAELSGGQRQRVAIARAVVNEPRVLLLDEPLSNLDKKLREKMQIELKNIQRQLGITFVFVTHDQEEALSMSDRIVVLNKGYIQQVGTPRDIYEEPKTLFVAGFIGGANILETVVNNVVDNKIEVNLAGTSFLLNAKKPFTAGQKVRVIIRPEDLEVWHPREVNTWMPEEKISLLRGKISAVIYKGSTVDLQIKLDFNDQTISATEFFNEDDQKLEYEIEETVLVRLKEGWEVILPDV